MTTIFGIIGDPVSQVRSPLVFNERFRSHGIDAIMVPMHIAPDDFESALDGLHRMKNLGGLVVTVPHKIAAARLLANPSRRCEATGAANALRWSPHGWIGDLFDGEGFAAGVEANHGPLVGRNCAIVGAGGAGVAIALALIDRNIRSLRIWDVDATRAADSSRRLSAYTSIPILLEPPSAADDIAINATPVGMEDDEQLPFQPSALKPDALVCEAIMKPPRTQLLIDAERTGHPIQEGRHMLDFQVDALWKFFGLPSSDGERHDK